MITEEECKRRIAFATESLRRELNDAYENLRAARYEAKVRAWAIAGLAACQKRPVLTISDFVPMKPGEAAQMAERLGDTAAHILLRESALEYVKHAEHHEALRHIYYLENHAGGRGVQFESWEDKKAKFGERPCEHDSSSPSDPLNEPGGRYTEIKCPQCAAPVRFALPPATVRSAHS